MAYYPYHPIPSISNFLPRSIWMKILSKLSNIRNHNILHLQQLDTWEMHEWLCEGRRTDVMQLHTHTRPIVAVYLVYRHSIINKTLQNYSHSSLDWWVESNCLKLETEISLNLVFSVFWGRLNFVVFDGEGLHHSVTGIAGWYRVILDWRVRLNVCPIYRDMRIRNRQICRPCEYYKTSCLGQPFLCQFSWTVTFVNMIEFIKLASVKLQALIR